MSARIQPMKSEAEITARLTDLRKRLEAEKDRHQDYKKQHGLTRSNFAKKSQRVLEGEIAGLAWVVDVPDLGPTPTVQ
jgi:uncharacterized protein involved in exopolysaccharide biosynthesis